MPIADQYEYVPWRRYWYLKETDCSWDAHTAKVVGKGETRVGNMNAILTDSHLDTRIYRYVMNVIVPKQEYAEVWEGNATLVKQVETDDELETRQMTAAKKSRRLYYNE